MNISLFSRTEGKQKIALLINMLISDKKHYTKTGENVGPQGWPSAAVGKAAWGDHP